MIKMCDTKASALTAATVTLFFPFLCAVNNSLENESRLPNVYQSATSIENIMNHAASSGRTAFLTVSKEGSPTFSWFDLFSNESGFTTYEKIALQDITKNQPRVSFSLSPIKTIRYNATSNTAWHLTHTPAANKNLIEKGLIRNMQSPESNNVLIDTYLKEIPLLVKINGNQGTLAALIDFLSKEFERAGITPSLQKPVLSIWQTDEHGKFAREALSQEQKKWLEDYFSLCELTNKTTLEFWQEKQEKYNAHIAKSFGTDNIVDCNGVLGELSRRLNKSYDKLKTYKILAKVLEFCITAGIVTTIITIFKNPTKHFREDCHNALTGKDASPDAIVDKNSLMIRFLEKFRNVYVLKHFLPRKTAS